MTQFARETWNGAHPAPGPADRLPDNQTSTELPSFEDALQLVRSQERHLSAHNMVALWAELYEHYPDTPLAFRMLVRGYERAGDHDGAIGLLKELPWKADTAGDRLRVAECVAELRQKDRAVPLFRQLLANDPTNARVMSVVGKYFKTKGDLLGAFEILSKIPARQRSASASALLDEVDDAIAAVEALSPGLAAFLPDPPRILSAALATFNARPITPLRPNDVGGITLYTGSLGAGGAERQMTRIAAALKARKSAGCPVGGHRLGGDVEVMVNATDPAKKKDFFRPDLEMAGVPITIVTELPATPFGDLPDLSPTIRDVLPLLPSHPRFGVERLVEHLRRTKPEVLYIWQDGAVLTGALAALIAGVPRIAISLRGLPPNMRPHLMKPEYQSMYRALAEIPGVSISCNSGAAAAAYADWLDLPRELFSVIYNAHQPLSEDPTGEAASLWRAFDTATQDAEMTIGGVFRFNENKRPLLWLDCARAALEKRPGLRFVLVGDGQDRAAAQDAAKAAGIDKRVLFVGHSKCVGFWLSKLDAVVHLAKNEGLPNVLIEAQAHGIPVIATPAGGSAETFVDGASGILLKSAENPTSDNVVDAIMRLFENRKRLDRMGTVAKRVAEDRFNVERVLNRTFRFFSGEVVGLDEEDCAADPTDDDQSSIPAFTLPGATAYNLFTE